MRPSGRETTGSPLALLGFAQVRVEVHHGGGDVIPVHPGQLLREGQHGRQSLRAELAAVAGAQGVPDQVRGGVEVRGPRGPSAASLQEVLHLTQLQTLVRHRGLQGAAESDQTEEVKGSIWRRKV